MNHMALAPFSASNHFHSAFNGFSSQSLLILRFVCSTRVISIIQWLSLVCSAHGPAGLSIRRAFAATLSFLLSPSSYTSLIQSHTDQHFSTHIRLLFKLFLHHVRQKLRSELSSYSYGASYSLSSLSTTSSRLSTTSRLSSTSSNRRSVAAHSRHCSI